MLELALIASLCFSEPEVVHSSDFVTVEKYTSGFGRIVPGSYDEASGTVQVEDEFIIRFRGSKWHPQIKFMHEVLK